MAASSPASESYEADLFVDSGRIALVGQGLSLPADTVVDASGCLVLPGGIDVHTHLDMPAGEIRSSDDFETGTRAAAFGGTTTVVDFALLWDGGVRAGRIDPRRFVEVTASAPAHLA